MKRLFLFVFIFMIFSGTNIFSIELFGYIKSFEVDETTYDRIIFLDQDKPIRDENGNLITTITQLSSGSYSGDIFNALMAACSNNWGIKLNVSMMAENASISYLKTPYPMGVVPVNGLVAEYLFNGNAADTSGKGNNGVIHGNIKSTNGKFKTPNSAFEFDGVDDYIDVPDSPSLRPENGSWSISLWFKTENKDQVSIIVCKRQDASPYETYGIGIGTHAHSPQAGKTLLFDYIEVAATVERSGVTVNAVVDGNWHHVVYVLDNQVNSVQVYIDNKLIPINLQYNAGAWPTINNSDPLNIGCSGSQYPQYRNYFKGTIENIRIYNIALTNNEVDALYNETGDTF